MTQNQVNQAVARATGESVDMIRRLGFLLADSDTGSPDDEILSVEVIDWDAVSIQRQLAIGGAARRACA